MITLRCTQLHRVKHLFLLCALVLLAGCAGNPPRTPGPVWPPAPNPPVIEYSRSIYGSHDLPRSFLARVKDFFFGKSPDMALGKPYGISFDGESTLYLVDTAKKGVMVLHLNTGKVNFQDSLGPYGRLVEPVNLIRDRSGNLYVADTGLKKIVVFDSAGIFARFIGENDLESPVGLAFDKDEERLFVSDTNSHSIKVFSKAGQLVGGFGQRGDQKGEFYHPLGIAINSREQLLVVDSFHFAVQVFDLEGNYQFSFGSTARGLGSMARPRGIAVDREDQIYVTDALKNNVQIFDPEGHRILEFGGQGFGPGQFRLPAGVFFTTDDRLFVVDSINKRVQEFNYVARGQSKRG